MSTTLQEAFDPKLLALSSTLERVPYTSKTQIGELARAGRPVVFTGALDHWPARSKWTPEYFREQWGNRSLDAHETKWLGKTPYNFLQTENAAQKTISDFFDGTSKDQDYVLYVHQIDAAEIFPGSVDDLRYPELIESEGQKFRPNIWMGTPGTRSGLHFDSAENLVAMFHGAKAVMLVDPRNPKLLYPFRYSPLKSRIDPMHVDWDNFPRLREANIYIDVLKPGEMLFLPRNWWHYLTSLKFSINATCWFFWKGVDAPESRSLFRAYLPYVFRCGPSYPLQFIYQFLWHGLLKRPYQRKALSPPPMGVRMWQRLRRPRQTAAKQ
jgi:lysine-specific demethylase 8